MRESVIRTCDICGKQFQTFDATRHLCSVECREKAAKAARAKIDHAKYLRRKAKLAAAKAAKE